VSSSTPSVALGCTAHPRPIVDAYARGEYAYDRGSFAYPPGEVLVGWGRFGRSANDRRRALVMGGGAPSGPLVLALLAWEGTSGAP